MKRSDAVDAHIGQRVRRRHLEMGLTQQALSRLLGVSYQQLQKYEHGTNRISIGMLWRLSEVLEMELAYFFADMSPGLRGQRSKKGGEPPIRGHSDREILELVKAYSQIANTEIRNAVRQMLHSFAKYGRRPRIR
jgi:transcriptional regulator with XRE-family HTH domain